MTITLSQLGQASADDNQISETELPNMLTVGDSLMWGQGLSPENRFRELVRQRLSQEGQTVRELSMARSGAKMHPALPPDTDDHNLAGSDSQIVGSFENGTILPKYSPEAFAREIPHQSLSTIEQLRTAYALLGGTNSETGENSIPALSESETPNNIRWMLLNGGINDFNFNNLLAPVFIGDAWHNDILAGWIAFIEEEAAKLGPKMEATLREAATLFPNATIVVNGYFPIFSAFSLGHKLDWYSVTLGHADNWGAQWTERLATNPITKPMLIEVSNAFRWASDIHIQNAVEKVNQEVSASESEAQQPRILFAYSNIEKHRCLFAPRSWLWGFARRPSQVLEIIDVIRNPRPFNLLLEDLFHIAPNLLPEDEVIQERRAQCINQLDDSFADRIICRLASLGHPNRGGAQGYANSIIETLEMFGAISSDHHRCTLGHRRRRRSCRNFASRLGLRRVEIEANMGRACSSGTQAIFGAATSHWNAAIDHATTVASNLQDAAACFDGAAGSMASASQQFFANASNRFSNVADNLGEAVECWDQTALDMQACDDQRAGEIAQCEANHQNRLDNECNIQCNSFTNCSDYGFIRRAACRTARAGCVALAATARVTCRAGSATLREACKAAAHAKSAVCKGAVALNNTVCTVSRIGAAIGNTFAGAAQVIVGIGAGIASLSSNIGCALGNVGRAFVNIGRGIVRGAIGTLVAAGAVIFFAGCTILRRVTASLINGIHRILDYGCRIGNGGISGLCWITSIFSLSSSGNSNARA
ncbi:hypothetical protein [Marinimicrobium alkaliphilum]|uniref:hypothetical protein n=1 Tax=Marinimicrobium alkaliphilum TaxID=2202654 RepID=UPI000DB91880|nr:hypothetical protein [Marinimicrobium alkaliphilum]